MDESIEDVIAIMFIRFGYRGCGDVAGKVEDIHYVSVRGYAFDWALFAISSCPAEVESVGNDDLVVRVLCKIAVAVVVSARLAGYPVDPDISRAAEGIAPADLFGRDVFLAGGIDVAGKLWAEEGLWVCRGRGLARREDPRVPPE